MADNIVPDWRSAATILALIWARPEIRKRLGN
jgi:hypothetical protein